MSRNKRRRIIGFCGAVWQEVVNLRLGGVVRYVEEHSDELGVRDFRYQSQHDDIEHRPPPPWTGIADGAIVCFGMDGDVDAMASWLARGRAPVVSLVRAWNHREIPVVDTDSVAACKMAADYFVERGFRHFAFIGDSFNAKETEARRERFAARLTEQRFTTLAYDLRFFPNGSMDDHEQVVRDKGLAQFLKQSPKPLALFAINDNFARAVCLLCEKLKLDVPGDVAILGSGNFTTSRCHSPTLSTVLTVNEQIGYEAARIVHAMMLGKPAPTRPKLMRPKKIIERQSTATETPPRDEIRAALEYLQQYACDGVNVDDIVRTLSVSRRSFEQRFLERIGQSPKQLIQQVRWERAQKLISDTELSVAQIAAMTGFHDTAAFTNFVRKQAGRSPSQLRQELSKTNLR